MRKLNNKLPELSVFFPAYNEAGNIEKVIKQAYLVLPLVAKKYEVIIINDGSKDNTKQIVQRLQKKYKNLKLVNQRNKGYGGALKRGFKESKYQWIFFTDSDLQFNMEELEKFISHTANNDLIIGYRLNRAEGWKRHILAKMLKLWNRVILNFPREIKDIDCAFKLIKKDVLKKIEPLISDGAMVSTEMLLKADRSGFRFQQIGVNHYQRTIGNPTGNNKKVIAKAVTDTFKLKLSLMKQKLSFTTNYRIDFSLKTFYTNW